MTEFLRQIANHYCDDCQDKVFVLPSQRAVVFFRKYLCEACAASGRTMLLPPIMSVDDFYASLGSSKVADRITLLTNLYECYKLECEKAALSCESLDDFIFWGDIIIGDFQDVDKYLVEPKGLFRNIAEYKKIQDDFADLEGEQKEAMKAFLSHFCGTDGEFKLRFSRVWDMMYPLYVAFNERLDAQGLSYQGGMYRKLQDDVLGRGAEAVFKAAFPSSAKVVVCGLNALCECEKKILDKLRDLSLAEFVWDWCSEWIKDPANKASFFMRDNVQRFPQAFKLEECKAVPEIEVLAVPSAVGQVQLLGDKLSKDCGAMDEHTAVMLPDERMLLPLLNTLPANVERVNVTMGFSMAESSFFSLISDICAMQLRSRLSGGAVQFYHRNVWSIVDNNIFEALCDEAGRQIVADMKKARRYYVPAESLRGSGLLDCLFTPAVDPSLLKTASAQAVTALADYLLAVVDHIGTRIASDEALKSQFPLEMDFAMECSRTLTLLRDKKLELMPQTFVRLFEGLVRSGSVPFKGEPLLGLQIMGPLELRALDFDTLYILSANESVFPRKSIASSFIPHFLRKDFGLPTYEYQDAVWAYYFYRSIQRCRRLCMIYDSRTDGLQSGEESRYIKQLRYHFGADMTMRTAVPVQEKVEQENVIAKTPEMVDHLHKRSLSASALKSYLKCRAQFYYSYVEGLRSEDEVAESLDAGMIGNVFHKVMEALYSGRTKIERSYVEGLLKDKDGIAAMVDQRVMAELNTDEIHGRNIVFARIIVSYVMKALERDLQFMEASGRDWFEFVGAELPMSAAMGSFKLFGLIDRLDSFADGTIRVVDYKTGKVEKNDVNIDASNASEIASSIFSPETSSRKRPEIALQFFVYDYLLRNGRVVPKDAPPRPSPCQGQNLINTVYSTRQFMMEQPVNVDLVEEFYDEMTTLMQSLLLEIEDLNVHFDRTEDTGVCAMCDFRNICGR